jgi:hypothetical protein
MKHGECRGAEFHRLTLGLAYNTISEKDTAGEQPVQSSPISEIW